MFGVDPNSEDENITEEEIRFMVDMGEENGTIHETEKEMINNVFEFNNKTASDIMTHRTDISALPVEADIHEVISFVNKEKYSRIPVYEGDIDNIIGVMHAKFLIQYLEEESNRGDFNLRDKITLPYFVPEFKRTDELFKEIKINKKHIAIVVDEYGGTAGIVTLEDLIEEIVGNIFDEDDEIENDIVEINETTFIINGTCSIDDVEGFFSIKFPVGKYETLGGFIIDRLGRIPVKEHDVNVEVDCLVFMVEQSDEKMISKVKVCKV